MGSSVVCCAHLRSPHSPRKNLQIGLEAGSILRAGRYAFVCGPSQGDPMIRTISHLQTYARAAIWVAAFGFSVLRMNASDASSSCAAVDEGDSLNSSTAATHLAPGS